MPESSFRLLDHAVSRRGFLGAAGLTSVAALLAACAPESVAPTGGPSTPALTNALNVYTWPDYFTNDDLASFATQYGVTPTIATYDDNNTLYTKLNSPGGSGYDVVVPSSSWVGQLGADNLLEPLDLSQLDLSGLDPNLLNRNYDPNNQYTIPKDFGFLGVVYNPDVVGEIATWQDFFDAGAGAGSGKVRLTSSAEETVGPALWINGKDWNTATVDDINGTQDFLTGFAKHVKTFKSFDPNALASGQIVLAQANQGAARNAIKLNPKLKWVLPGPWTELWVDTLAIAKGAPDLGRAYQFLQYQLTPQIQINETVAGGFPAALNNLKSQLPAGTDNVDLIFGGANVDYDKLTSYVINPDTQPAFQAVQEAVVAAAGQ